MAVQEESDGGLVAYIEFLPERSLSTVPALPEFWKSGLPKPAQCSGFRLVNLGYPTSAFFVFSGHPIIIGAALTLDKWRR